MFPLAMFFCQKLVRFCPEYPGLTCNGHLGLCNRNRTIIFVQVVQRGPAESQSKMTDILAKMKSSLKFELIQLEQVSKKVSRVYQDHLQLSAKLNPINLFNCRNIVSLALSKLYTHLIFGHYVYLVTQGGQGKDRVP
jgi:hypothetical protein